MKKTLSGKKETILISEVLSLEELKDLDIQKNDEYELRKRLAEEKYFVYKELIKDNKAVILLEYDKKKYELPMLLGVNYKIALYYLVEKLKPEIKKSSLPKPDKEG